MKPASEVCEKAHISGMATGTCSSLGAFAKMLLLGFQSLNNVDVHEEGVWYRRRIMSHRC